ncbi:MAG: ATP-binding protein [Planctomycetes bacterium]|nr:ATP-binding protein [Planctomycetota bacterium]
MSANAPAQSFRPPISTLEMRVANMTFMLERLAQDCAPLQFVRELTQNSIDSIKAHGGHPGEIHWDVDWITHDLEPSDGYKLSIIDTGIGMTGQEMVSYINQLSSSMHEQSKHGNFGMGAKIATAPRNTQGVVYLSWKDGVGSMIHLWKDPATGTYGLRRHENGEFWVRISNDVKPALIKKHGTKVVLLGNKPHESTMDAPDGAQIPSRWVLRYLNMRYFRFPDGVTVRARENWTLPSDHKHFQMRKVAGQAAYLKANAAESGTVELSNGKAHWWILKEKVDDSGSNFSSGHVGALFNDELYEMQMSRSGVARLQSFGVIFGYNRVVIYVEPTQDRNGRLTANTARTHLLIEGHPLPWNDWAAEFRNAMPEAITRLMDKVAAGTSGADNASSIRERLKQIRDLFRFTRYRPKPEGTHSIDTDLANGGGRSKSNGNGGGRNGGGKGGSRSRAGDVYSLFADTGDTPAEEVGGMTDPIVKWVSVADGTRSSDFLEDRAAKYLPQANTIQANADFRVFTDMVARWRKFYTHVPGVETAVEVVVREWFQQQLVETVLGALALRKTSSTWSEVEAEELWSENALTSAVLPRYHVDLSIKRTLGQKIGTLKGQEVGS